MHAGSPPHLKIWNTLVETDGWRSIFLSMRAQGVCPERRCPKVTVKNRIRKENTRLLKLYAALPANKLEIVTPLIQNAAFLKVTLEDLQTEINNQGCVDTYQNGKEQSGKKASAEISAYNTSLKNYTTIIEKLDKMLPPEQKKSKLDAFANDE